MVLERLLEDGEGLARLAETILDETEAHVHAALVAEGAVLEQLDRAHEVLLGARQVTHRRVRVPYVLAQRGGGAHNALLLVEEAERLLVVVLLPPG